MQNNKEEQEALVSKMKEISGTSNGILQNAPVQDPQGACNKLQQYETEQAANFQELKPRKQETMSNSAIKETKSSGKDSDPRGEFAFNCDVLL